ncbi:MAG: hypothetical protein F6K26_36720 [Moorea sp. SIO2I5]|nr:hypothetical protein [Moorena sp. SIO2I5]
MNHFELLLQGMVNNPEACLKDLSLLTSAQQQLSVKLAKEMAFDWDFALCS